MVRWGRSDQVGLETLLWVVPALGVASLVAGVVRAGRGEDIRLVTAIPDDVVPERAGVRGPYEGTVVLPDPSAAQHAVHLLPHLLAVLLAITVAWLLLAVVRDGGAGEPFSARSARRLTWLAGVVAAGGVALQLVSDMARNSLVSEVASLGDLPTTFELSFWPLAAGLLIAFLAEVFARGAALRRDVEGLV